MTLLLVFLAIAVLGLVAVLAAGRLRTGPVSDAVSTAVQGLAEPDPRLPPVLLPANPGAADIQRLRLSVALRGYRMDQVDAVFDRLAGALAERDARISELEAAAGSGPAPAGDSQ